jgi:hypothetical protein
MGSHMNPTSIHAIMSSSSSLESNAASGSSLNQSNGTNVQPIVELLVQVKQLPHLLTFISYLIFSYLI